MKQIILAVLGIVILLGTEAAWLYASLPRRAQTSGSSLNDTPSFSMNIVLNEIQSGASFHVYFPESLPLGYSIAANVNAHIDGRVFYTIDASSGVPLYMVNEAPMGGPAAQALISPDQLRDDGSVSSTDLSGEPVYLGTETIDTTPPETMTVALFTRNGVEIQLSSLDAVGPQSLVELVNVME
jgi:hypothetical protein